MKLYDHHQKRTGYSLPPQVRPKPGRAPHGKANSCPTATRKYGNKHFTFFFCTAHPQKGTETQTQTVMRGVKPADHYKHEHLQSRCSLDLPSTHLWDGQNPAQKGSGVASICPPRVGSKSLPLRFKPPNVVRHWQLSGRSACVAWVSTPLARRPTLPACAPRPTTQDPKSLYLTVRRRFRAIETGPPITGNGRYVQDVRKMLWHIPKQIAWRTS